MSDTVPPDTVPPKVLLSGNHSEINKWKTGVRNAKRTKWAESSTIVLVLGKKKERG